MSEQLDALRREFPPIDMGYARKRGPALVQAAERYNAARAAIDPAKDETIVRARLLKAKAVALDR